MTTNQHALDRAALRALAEKATPGPWRIEKGKPEDEWDYYVINENPMWGIVATTSHADEARYIAATDPATVLALLEEADRHAALVEAILRGDWNDAARRARGGE